MRNTVIFPFLLESYVANETSSEALDILVLAQILAQPLWETWPLLSSTSPFL